MAKKSAEERLMEAAGSAAQAGDILHSQTGSFSQTGRDARRNPKDIKPRANGATRSLDPYHVLDLAESVSALGLLQPIAIDRNNLLVAGEHRLEAFKLLNLDDSETRLSHWEQISLETDKKIKDIDHKDVTKRVRGLDATAHRSRYQDLNIPVLSLPFNSDKDIDDALAAEAAENEKRQNYSRQEIQKLAEKLKKAGYIEKSGRPKKGERSLKKALTVISGKSFRQIERDLEKPKTPTHDGVFDEIKELKKISKTIERFLTNLPNHHLSNSFRNLQEEVGQTLKSNSGLP